ncbi:hypothetical protein HQQ75_44225, partial [Corallococcus exiguus]|nr:hypothetical protein [Corallococcus exiguus]
HRTEAAAPTGSLAWVPPYALDAALKSERRKEGKKERRKEGKKERRKEGRKERRREGGKERKKEKDGLSPMGPER